MQSRAPKMVVPWARSQNEKGYHVYLDFVHCISNLVSYLVSGVHPSDRHFQVDVLTLKQYTSLCRFLDDRPPTIIKKLSTKSYAKPEMCPAKILLILTVRAPERVRFWHENVTLLANHSFPARKAELWLAERCAFSCQNGTSSGTLTVYFKIVLWSVLWGFRFGLIDGCDV